MESRFEVCEWECEVCECVKVVTELAKYRLGSVGVQEVSWDKGGTAQYFCREVNCCTLTFWHQSFTFKF
jgi:hypothetical protein